MQKRRPYAAGRFFPATLDGCVELLDDIFDRAGEKTVDGKIFAAVLPHAGWTYSGATAASAIVQFAEYEIDTFVIFGTVHVQCDGHTIDASDAWGTPLGDVAVDAALRERAITRTQGLALVDATPHAREHSIEVIVPMLQRNWPAARILPIMAWPTASAAELGRAIGRAVAEHGGRTMIIGSADLTHYGSSFGFTPRGTGPDAVEWVRNENDRRLIRLMEEMRAEEIVAEADASRNTCGPGSIAAGLAAARELGATSGRLTGYATSYDVSGDGDASHFVGYAGMVFV